MKRLFPVLAVLAVFGIGIAPAFADHNKPDPQPTHGNDCTNHNNGNQEGNEDHCLPTTTTTTEQPTTTTTAPTTTTQPTTTTTEPDVTSTTSRQTTPTSQPAQPPAQPTTSTTVGTVGTTPSSGPSATACVDANGFPYTTSYATCPTELASPAVTKQLPGELPRTGSNTLELGIVGLFFLAAGGFLWRLGRAGR